MATKHLDTRVGFMSFGPPETGAEPLRRVRRALKAMSTPSRARVSLRFMGPRDRLWGAIQDHPKYLSVPALGERVHQVALFPF